MTLAECKLELMLLGWGTDMYEGPNAHIHEVKKRVTLPKEVEKRSKILPRSCFYEFEFSTYQSVIDYVIEYVK